MNNSKQRLVEYLKANSEPTRSRTTNCGELFARLLDEVDDAYLDFIVSSLSGKEIKFYSISNRWQFSFVKKTVYINVKRQNMRRVVFHEIGHGIDFIENVKKANGRDCEKAFSNQVILSNGKTLDKTVKSEIKEHADEIYDEIYRRREEEVFSYLPKDAVDKYKTYVQLEQELKSLKVKPGFKHWHWYDKLPTYEEMVKNPFDYISWQRYYSTKKEAQKAYDRKKEITEILGDYKEFNRVISEVLDTRQYKEFNQRYGIVADMLSGVKMLDFEFLGHSRAYFKRGGAFGSEFFADCFSTTVCNDTESYRVAKSLLPQSTKMFDELLHMIMEENKKAQESVHPNELR